MNTIIVERFRKGDLVYPKSGGPLMEVFGTGYLQDEETWTIVCINKTETANAHGYEIHSPDDLVRLETLRK